MSFHDKLIEQDARVLYATEYAGDEDDKGWDAAPGWEREMFCNRARANRSALAGEPGGAWDSLSPERSDAQP